MRLEAEEEAINVINRAFDNKWDEIFPTFDADTQAYWIKEKKGMVELLLDLMNYEQLGNHRAGHDTEIRIRQTVKDMKDRAESELTRRRLQDEQRLANEQKHTAAGRLEGMEQKHAAAGRLGGMESPGAQRQLEFGGPENGDPASPGDSVRTATPEERYAGGEDPTLIALASGSPPGAMNPAVVDSDLRSARSMAGVPNNASAQQQPPQQQQGVVRGYGGSSFLGNDDLQSQATGNYNPYPGNGPRGPPAPRPGGDVIANPAKQSRNNTTDSLRPYFRLGGPSDVSPSESQQLATRILHTDFGTVVPGSGLGVTNKLFVMNQLREKNIHYMGQLPLPRPYDGPSGLVVPEPIQWQNLITKEDRNTLMSREIAHDLSAVLLESRSGAGSLNITGDDFGQMSSVSARGLKRDADSPLEPIIRLPPQKMQRVKLADGFALSHRHTRRLFDAQRYPERFEPNVAQSGGPTYSRKSALALYPFPLG